MGRNSKELDKKLMLIGMTMIQELGASGLSMREVAKNANVNLGMLAYHFDGKDDFIKKCLLEIYSPFLDELRTISITKYDEKNFELFLLKLAQFAQKNRRLIVMLLKDYILKDRATSHFIKENFTEHFFIIRKALSNYLDLNNSNDSNIDYSFSILISNIGMPNLIIAVKEIVSGNIITNEENEVLLKKRIKLIIQMIKNLN